MPENIPGFFFIIIIYRQDSLNDETRQKIVTGVYRKVIGNCRPPKSWNSFIICDENKTEIFGFLVDKFILAQLCTGHSDKKKWWCLQCRN